MTPDEKLIVAIKKEDVEEIIKAIDEGANIQLEDEGGWNALHIACRHNSRELLQKILKDATFNLNKQICYSDSVSSVTALDFAFQRNYLDIIKALINHGAQHMLVNERYVFPFDIRTNKMGEGRYGTVFYAYDKITGEFVMLKSITEEFFEEQNLAREVQIAHELTHDNIIRIFDYQGQIGENGLRCFSMEFIEGAKTLAFMIDYELIDLTLQQRFAIIKDICNGIKYMHKKGYVHLDIKPANILYKKDIGCKIIDFGSTQKISDNMHLVDNCCGTFEYMAPEHFDGKPCLQSDIFSIGILFYQLFVGRGPFIASIPITKLVENIPALVNVIFNKATIADLDKRYKTVEEMLTDILKAEEDFVSGVNATAENSKWKKDIGDVSNLHKYCVEILKATPRWFRLDNWHGSNPNSYIYFELEIAGKRRKFQINGDTRIAAIRDLVNDIEKKMGYDNFNFQKIFKYEILEKDNALRLASNYDPTTGNCKPAGWYCYEVRDASERALDNVIH